MVQEEVCSNNIVSIEYVHVGYTDSFEWTRENLIEDFVY